MVMMLLAGLTLCSASALAADAADDGETLPVRSSIELPERRSGVRVPPLRVEHRVSMRDRMVPAAVNELGLQVLRRDALTVDGVVSLRMPAGLGVPGTAVRRMGSVDAGVDTLLEVSNWFAIGPAACLSFRWYRQNWSDVGATVTPVLGVKTHLGLLRARYWSLGIGARVNADLVATDLVLDTAQIVRISPLDAQIGLRVQFGYGRDTVSGRRQGDAG